MAHKKFHKKDKQLMDVIFKLSPQALQRMLYEYLKKYYHKEIVYDSDYLYAEGNIPIALVAHLDTVFDKSSDFIFFDSEYQVYWSPSGLGADDRAGVFAILKIISHGFRPHIIFTQDEEIGGIGAKKLAIKGNPFKDLRYIIELDRQGIDECVFYQCGNIEFYNYVESFGFNFDYGSFSDISFLCPYWDIAGVNLSIGYVNEHSTEEHLFCEVMLQTIEKVENMLSDNTPSQFDYQKIKTRNGFLCSNCNNLIDFSQGVFIKRANDSDMEDFFCEPCLNKLCWCERCHKPFEPKDDMNVLYCPECIQKGEIEKE